MTIHADHTAALRGFYERVDAHVASHSPRCEMSGRCCDFPRSEHELFCSDLETSYAVNAAGGTVPEASSGQCPWYVDGMCRLRDGRPLGCRLYFCDPDWEGAPMTDAYEVFHAELRELHNAWNVPYRYRRFVDATAEQRDGAR